MKRSQPITMQLYCRIEVAVTDPDAVTDLAASQLRQADIDWTQEEDDIESAAAELRSNLTQSLAAVVEEHRMFDNVPGAEIRGGLTWAEIGTPRGDFLPGRA